MPGFVVGRRYSRPDIRAVLGVAQKKGGPIDTGYFVHDGAIYLLPNVGVPGRTGHDYPNQWVEGRLRWYARINRTLEHASTQAMLREGSAVHLFTREVDREPFTYHGRVRAVRVVDARPPEIWWQPVESDSAFQLPEERPYGKLFREGATETIAVDRRERNPAVRLACIAHWGTACAVCGLRLEHRYGAVAHGFIHVHHLNPLGTGERNVDPVADLRPICPNCHGVAHLRSPPYTIAELQAMMQAEACARP